VSELAIVFGIGPTYCALPAGVMQEILEDAYVAPTPMAPASIEGVLNRLGRLYVVFDLGSLIGVPLEVRQKLILFGHDQFSFAAWVDSVHGVANVDTDRLETEPVLPFQAATLRFKDRIVPMLDAEALFRRVDELI
jgi:chemotaxis signal transduction protein